MKPTARLEPGSFIIFNGEQHTVTGLTGPHIHLRHSSLQTSVWLLTEVVDCPDFRVLTDADGVGQPEPDTQQIADLSVLDALDATQRAVVQKRLNAVLLVRDARLPGDDLDAELAPLGRLERIRVVAKRVGSAPRSVRRWAEGFDGSGLAGLVDNRLVGAARPLGKIDPRWRNAFTTVLNQRTKDSHITDRNLIELVEAEALRANEVPPTPVSESTMRRNLKEMRRGRGTHLSTKAQRSIANRPSHEGGWRRLVAARAGEVVAIDTNKLDTFGMDAITGEWCQVQLMLAIDLCTRSLVGWRFTGWEPTAADTNLLLRHIVSPKRAGANWPSIARWRYAGVPETLVAGLLESDPLLPEGIVDENSPIAGVPVVNPDQIVMDRGKIYTAQSFKEACEMMGSNLEFGRPYTPTDKAHIERVFGTINTGFVQKLPGYKGPDIHSRGAKEYVEDGAFLFIDEIADRFAEWVATVYQNAPHDGLVHPSVPGVTLTPNQGFDLSISHAGYVPVPVDRNLQIELLETVWLTVGAEGLTRTGLTYDFDTNSFMDNYRNRRSPFTNNNGKWRVKVDRRDVSRLWFFDFDNAQEPELGKGQWRAVPVRGIPEGLPFQDRHLAYVKRVIAERGDDRRDRHTVVKELGKLLARIHTNTDALSKDEKRIAAHAEAVARLNTAAVTKLSTDADRDTHEQYFSGDDAYDPFDSVEDHGEDGAEPVSITGTTTRKPRKRVTELSDAPPHPMAMDDVEEYDPFNDIPDIA